MVTVVVIDRKQYPLFEYFAFTLHGNELAEGVHRSRFSRVEFVCPQLLNERSVASVDLV